MIIIEQLFNKKSKKKIFQSAQNVQFAYKNFKTKAKMEELTGLLKKRFFDMVRYR